MSRSALAAFALYAALTVMLTWPLAAGLGSVIPSDVGDPILNTWILAWNASHVPLTTSWWNAPAFFPATGVLAFSEHLLGLVPIASPIIWLTGRPLVAYNVIFLLSFPLSAVAAYLLGLELTGRRDAAFLAGLSFGFAPYRIAHLGHLQILAAWWMPLALAGLHKYVREERARWLALFAAAWLMQALSNGYFLPFFSVLVGLWVLWFVPVGHWRTWLAIGTAWAIAALPLMPILWEYRRIHDLYGFGRSLQVIVGYSADLAAVLTASPHLAIWGRLRVYDWPEGALFTGVTVVAIIGFGLTWRRRPEATEAVSGRVHDGRPVLAFYVVAAIAMYVLALGPAPAFLGTRLGIPGPYAWLLHVPGLDALRVPARFGMMMVVCLSAAAAVGYARIGGLWSSVRRAAVAGVVGTLIVAESWLGGMPLWDAPRAWDIQPAEITSALLVLPVINELNDAGSMYRAMAHGRPIVNGYSGYFPPWYYAMKDALNSRDPTVLDELSRAGVSQIGLVKRNDREGIWDRYIRTRATLVRVAPDESFALYDLPAAQVLPPRPFGPALAISSVEVSGSPEAVGFMLDGDLMTRWRVGPQTGAEELTIDLGAEQRVSAVELQMGSYGLEYPREVVVEISNDHARWTEVRRARGDLSAMTGARRAPREMPVSLDVGDRTARFIRVRQVGNERDRFWTIAELRVFGPAR